jgi:hypothetical protein
MVGCFEIIYFCAASSFERVLAQRITLKPYFANAKANALPIPLLLFMITLRGACHKCPRILPVAML